MTDIKTRYLVEDHFPEYFKENGQTLIYFLESFYDYLEQEKLILPYDIPNYLDIDNTLDEFIEYFKRTYFKNVRFSETADVLRLIKHNKDIYDSRGTESGMKLLFSILFNEKIKVTYPKEYIIKPSDGYWEEPIYIEASPNDKNFKLIDETIRGSNSSATAVVEGVVRRLIDNKYIDVIYLSNLNGNFLYGESILNSENVDIETKVIGSLSYIDVIDGGKNNKIGDYLNIISNFGKSGLARVIEVENGTGKVDFTLVDGGYGFRSNSNVNISEIIFKTSETNGIFLPQEEVYQPIQKLNMISGVDSFTTGDNITGYTSGTWITQAQGLILSINNNSITVYCSNGDFRFSDIIKNVGNTHSSVIDTVDVINPTGKIAGANTTHIGIYNISSDFFVFNGLTEIISKIDQSKRANIIEKGQGYGATFEIGSLTNTETVVVMPDLVNSLNSSNNNFLNIKLDGAGSGVGFINSIEVGKSLLLANSTISNPMDLINQKIYYYDYANTMIGSAHCYYANNTHIKIYQEQYTSNVSTSHYIHSSLGNANITNITLLGGSGYSNTDNISIVGGGGTISNINIVSGGSGYSNGNILLFNGTNEDAKASIVTNGLGTITAINFIDGGKQFVSPPIITIANTLGIGASLTCTLDNLTAGNGSIITNNTGNIISGNVTVMGANYYSRPSINFISTSGINGEIFPVVDFGYGLVKNIHGDDTNYFDSILRKENMEIGTIGTISGINPGNDYNMNPFVLVNDPIISSFDRKDMVLNLSNKTGEFIIGENIYQNITTPLQILNIGSVTGNVNFNIGETISQGNNTATIKYIENGIIHIEDYTNSFIQTSNSSTTIYGFGSNASANVLSTTFSSYLKTSKGKIFEISNNDIKITRKSFNLSFNLNNPIIGSISGTQAMIDNMYVIDDSLELGNNAIIDSVVKSANGIASKIEIIDSGFGYIDTDRVVLKSDNNIYELTGVLHVNLNGKGQGYYSSQKGFPSSSYKIQDGDYYQIYSYEIETSVSIEHYKDIVKELCHVAGTKMFGKISLNNVINIDANIDNLLTQTL